MIRRITAAVLAALLVTGQTLGQSAAKILDEPPPPPRPETPSVSPMAPTAPAGEASPELAGLWHAGGPADPGASDWRLWANFDYLVGWMRGDPLPPLVTTSPDGTARTAAGVLNQPGTSILFGMNSVNTQEHSGLRTEMGYWFTPQRDLGIETGFFFLDSTIDSFLASSTGSPILARPFLNAAPNALASSLVAFPGVSTGSVLVKDSAHTFYGWNLALRQDVLAGPWYRFDALFGYRYLRFDEGLQIQQNVQPLGSAFAAGTNILATDSFATRNIFNGFDFGMRADFTYSDWSLGLLGKLAAGYLHRTTDINGSQLVAVPNQAPVLNSGGFLALSSNIGTHTSEEWQVVPEVGVTLGWQISRAARLTMGYSVLWWFKVAEPGDQIDFRINPGLIPPATAPAGSPSIPAFPDNKSTVLVQTLNFGLEFRY